MAIVFPFHLHRGGRHADRGFVIRDWIEQVLFTSPGERVNRPDFGCGLMQMTFAGLGDPVVTALEASVAGSLQRWLGEAIHVESVRVSTHESTLEVSVQYVDRQTQSRAVAAFVRQSW